MPEYSYISKRGKIVTVFQHMNDEHRYFEGKEEFQRVWQVPQATMDTEIDVFSKKDFMKKTSKGDKIGALWERSKEWAEKRTQKAGKDPVKTQYIKDQAAKGKAGRERARIIQDAHNKKVRKVT